MRATLPSTTRQKWTTACRRLLPSAFRAEVTRRLRLSAEGDWTGWGGAFQTLPVKLKQGTNATINSVVGSNAFTDHIALRWRNQGALHTGFEAPLSSAWTVRGGYSFLSDPVPSATLTPLTAAILRHALSAGAGWAHGAWSYDLAYQAQLPAPQSVGQSSLEAGEFSQSHVRVSTQSLTLSTRFAF